MKYVVMCSCGAKTGVLPPGIQPPPPPGAPKGFRLTQEQLKRAKVCCQCGRQLDDSKGQYMQQRVKPVQVENMLSVAGASNSR